MIRAARRLFKSLAVFLALISPGAPAAELPAPVREALRAAGIPRAALGVVVQEAGARSAALSVNPGEPMNPASVMKLVTTYAALDLLTPAYRWKTEAYVEGALRDGVLEGNLILRGTGDPKLNYESFWMLLRALRGRGLREIRGDLILDRSYFGPVAQDRIDDEQFRPYNVAPDALLVNFKSLRFMFVPEGERVHVFAEPSPPGLEIANRLRVAPGACPEGRAFRDVMQAVFASSPQPRAAFTGKYPAECGERELNVALHPPEDYAAGLLRLLWGEMGGRWSGTVRNGAVPEGARLLYVHESQPLAEIVRDVNKFSNNVMARQLYLTLAAELGGPPATTEKGAEVVRQWLLLRNLPGQGLVIENGSGLSRTERASAATLAALLQAAWASPVMPEFVASLPLASVDGTMRKRLHGERVAGQAHIKTGLLSDVRSAAGYVLDRRGRRHAVVMIINHPNAPQADAAFDALLAWVYEGATAQDRSTSRQRGASPGHP